MKRYDILINSCDVYKDAWPMFFHIFRQTWTGEFPVIYLNTETETFEFEGLEIRILNSRKNLPWGQRLNEALARIDTEYILMMLEDFYFEQPINVSVIDRCAEYLDKDKSILAFQLVPAGEAALANKSAQSNSYGGFVRRKKWGAYTFIAGPVLWRKKDLAALTMNSDSPWIWEFFGSMRTRLYGKKIYCWVDKMHPVFDYDIEHGGVIHRGKWVGYKLRELEEKYGYKLDYGDREIIDDWMKCKVKVEKKHEIKKILYNRSRPVFDTAYGLIKRISGQNLFKWQKETGGIEKLK